MPNKLTIKKSIGHLNKSNDLFIQSLNRQRPSNIEYVFGAYANKGHPKPTFNALNSEKYLRGPH